MKGGVDQDMKEGADQEIKGGADREMRGVDQEMKGGVDQEMKGGVDQDMKEGADQEIKRGTDQEMRGVDQEMKGGVDQEMKEGADQEVEGRADQMIGKEHKKHHKSKSKKHRHGIEKKRKKKRRKMKKDLSSNSSWSSDDESDNIEMNDIHLKRKDGVDYMTIDKKVDECDDVKSECENRNKKIRGEKAQTKAQLMSTNESSKNSEQLSITKSEQKTSKSTTEDHVEYKKHSIQHINTLSSRRIEIKIISDVKQTSLDNRKDSRNDKKSNFDLIGKWEPVEKESLRAFTDLCKTIVEKDKFEKVDNSSTKTKKIVKDEESDEIASKVRHPFQVKPIEECTFAPITPQNPAQAIQAGRIYQIVGNVQLNNTPSNVMSSFPVSSGVQHRKKESNPITHNNNHDETVFEQNAQKVNINELIAERLKIQQELKNNPFCFKSQLKLKQLDESIDLWSKSRLKPEQFTGEKTKNILRKEELQGGYSAWTKKNELSDDKIAVSVAFIKKPNCSSVQRNWDFFYHLQPITNGKGLEMLQKMGWKRGEPLGKNRQGYINPIQLEVRTDRKGLATVDEDFSAPRNKKRPNSFFDVQGKHPVSALAEFCTKKRWIAPDYKLTFDAGPAHDKQYVFTVHVNGVDYCSTVASPNKKTAKAQAASIALSQITQENQ
eukprot:gene297-923_t